MAINYNKSFFEGFKKIDGFLDKISSEDMRNKIANEIAKKGAEFAVEEYSGENVVVSTNEASDGKAKIVAQGQEVAYIEFGTGEEGRATYPGILPSVGVPLTGSWQYYYPSKHKRTLKDGTLGWFHNKKFHIGRKAGACMWRTAIDLRKDAIAIAKGVIKKEMEKD
jgi:hypothetical protein